MAAEIINPLVMTVEEAKSLCEKEPYLFRCELLKEKIIEDKKTEKKDKKKTAYEYAVFSAHFE